MSSCGVDKERLTCVTLIHERKEIESDERSAHVGVLFDIFVVIEKFGCVDSPAGRVHEYGEDCELKGEEKERREEIEQYEEDEGVCKPGCKLLPRHVNSIRILFARNHVALMHSLGETCVSV